MARPQTKEELITAAQTKYDQLLALIDSMSPLELETEFDFSDDPKKKEAHWSRDKNLRDVIMHLHEWHNLMLQWLANNKAGIRRPFLLEGYNWKTYGNMNAMFWQKNQDVSLEEALERFKDSHQKIMAEIEKMTNDEFEAMDTIDELLNGNSEIRAWGLDSFAYIKPTVIDNEPMWSIYTADGNIIASASNPDSAKAFIKNNDLKLALLN